MNKIYWHLVSTLQPNILHHNVKISKGILYSIQYLIDQNSGYKGFTTLYNAYSANNPKEKYFESLREKKFPGLPSRLNNFFVFDDIKTAEWALNVWFNGKDRVIEECYFLGGKLHKADSCWLNCIESEYEEYAIKYWRGEMSRAPQQEIIACGAFFFPRWEEFPLISNPNKWKKSGKPVIRKELK